MRAAFLVALVGMLFVLLQSSVMPLFLSPNWRPSLLMILALYLALSENLFKALMAGLLLGAMQDSYSGTTLGLYISVFLLIILAVHHLSDHFNTESKSLLVLLIAAATIMQNFLLVFFLALFSDGAPSSHIILFSIPQQLLTNTFFSLVMLLFILRCQKVLGNRSGLAGLMYQSKRHVS